MARGIGWGVVLLLAVVSMGCAGLWVRSYYRSDEVWCVGDDGSWQLRLDTSADQIAVRLFIACDERPVEPEWERAWTWTAEEGATPTGTWHEELAQYPATRYSGTAVGFDWFVADGRADGDFAFPRVRAVGVPLWFLTLITGAVPLLATRKAMLQRRARRRRHRGFCERCGYDLRASSERCPECGTPVGA